MDDDLERAVDEALGGNPRAAEIGAMVEALEERRAAIAAEKPNDSEAVGERRRRLAELDRQVAVLREDMAVSSFVEASVRVAAARQQIEEGG